MYTRWSPGQQNGPISAPAPPQPDWTWSQNSTSFASRQARICRAQTFCASLKVATATFSSGASACRRSSAWGPCACVVAPSSPTRAKKFCRKTMLRTPRRRIPPIPSRPPVTRPRRSSTFDRSPSPPSCTHGMCVSGEPYTTCSGEEPRELLLRIGGESQRQLASDLDDRPPHAAAVLGEPGDQLVPGEPLRLGAALRRDERLGAARFLRERAQLRGRERLLDQVALFDLLLLSREKLPRLHAARSAGLAVVADHAGNLEQIAVCRCRRRRGTR